MATLCLTDCLLLTGAMKMWPQQESVGSEKANEGISGTEGNHLVSG